MDKQGLVKHLLLGFIMGMIYFTLEGLWRGWTHIAMLFIGGLCATLVGQLNQYPQYYKFKIWQQSLIGTLIVLIIELISGLVLNVGLGLNLWSYSDMWGNLFGQVCIQYAVLWFILVPFCIWLDDCLRFKLYGEGKPYAIKEIYWELITLR